MPFLVGYERLVARRQFKALRRRRRSAVTARIASVGVGIGVAALVIVLSVMNGFSGLLWERLLSLSPHVTVRQVDGDAFRVSEDVVARVRGAEDVSGATPFIETQGYLLRRPESGGSLHAGVTVIGMSAEGLEATSDIASYMWAGDTALGEQTSENGRTGPGILIGSYLADRLGAVVGSEIRMGLPPAQIGAGRGPLLRRYVVSGIFRTEYPEFDTATVFVSLASAQSDLEWGDAVTGVRVRLVDPMQAESAREQVASILEENVRVSAWMDDHQNLYASIQLEKWSFYLGLSLIVVVAGFNIISILSMNVAERRKDIGILKAMGATERSIGNVFSLMGLRIGLSGVVVGTCLGFTACWIQLVFEPLKLPGDIYIVNALPVEMRIADFALISLSAVVLCYLFTLIPSREAASLDPVEAIRG